ncbi:hypothetical protein FHS79_001236 [Polymorphobacter multimanifer]|uniref:Uncharacterized protein n=1 Tax=Polymorphobacter multimanifer TaxID=1070431 RepID=A0A841L381_9SPHN|nr:hypothetical protein [Polymorphobacter multimanifer]MBB6227074.1 hypothetical protein [Polymorphobacter multimanifer]
MANPDTPDTTPGKTDPVTGRPLADKVDSINRVRPAGPENMEDPPEEGWDEIDQSGDESFPASDPPGQGVG